MKTPQEDLDYYESMSPTFAGKKFIIPPPKLSPEKRRQRRMAFRNERHLYHRTCDLTGRKMLSSFSPDKVNKVYYFKDWMGDKWDAMDYGMEPNYERAFFEQFGELIEKVPVRSLNITNNMENCDFCNYGGFCKDCYLCIASFESQNCYYSRVPYKCNYDVDGFANIECQFVYECIICEGCYECFFSQYSKSCSESAFLIDCISCKNCFGCVGLKHQEYCFLNKKYSPEEYKEKIDGILNDRETLDKFKKFFQEFSLKFPRKFNRNSQAENCSGDLVRHAKNCKDCFDIFYQEDCRYCELTGGTMQFSYDCTITGLNVAKCYEQIGCLGCTDCAFGVYVSNNQNCYYLMNCQNCEHCFGCTGLKRKKHCIFNKQYSPEEYEKTVAQIIEKMIERGEWGEMFPMEISPFEYHETLANDYFPLEKIETKEKAWKTIKQEEEFLKKYGIALPNKSPEARALARLHSMNPYKLWERTTQDGVQVQSPYSPERPEIILSEKAYQNHMFLT